MASPSRRPIHSAAVDQSEAAARAAAERSNDGFALSAADSLGRRRPERGGGKSRRGALERWLRPLGGRVSLMRDAVRIGAWRLAP
jgi:hypothetical protein